MQEKFYPFAISRSEFRYEFVSVSDKKEVQKIVLLTQTEENIVYNLALLDVLENGSLCDINETNNNDLRIVMATVMRIIGNFLASHQGDYVMIRGNDARRNRLYRIIISREFEELSKYFEILGVRNGMPQYFVPNENFDYYLIGKYENSKKDN